MNISKEDVAAAAAGLTIFGLFVAAARWLFTNDTAVRNKVLVLEARLGSIETKLDDLIRSVGRAFERGDDRMQKHEDSITALKVQAAELRRLDE